MSFMYYGGKSNIANKIISYFPEHITFIEVFGGSAELIFRKKPSKVEVYNDIDDGLTAIFQCLLDDELRKELIEYLEKYPVSRTLFFYLRKKHYEDIVRKAFRKFYLLRYSFNANCRSFGYTRHILKGSNKKFDINGIEKLACEAQKRNLIIENQDFAKLIKRFDFDTVLIYLDPPYYEVVEGYEFNFTEEDHKRLFETLKGLQNATWFLSYNKHEFISDLYKDYFQEILTIRYANYRSKKSGVPNELLISNQSFTDWNIYNQLDSKLESFFDFTTETVEEKVT